MSNSDMFLASSSGDIVPGRPCVIGLPLDETATYRSGSDEGPAAIRRASESIETYSPFLDRDLSDLPFSDVGDVSLSGATVEESLETIYQKTRTVLCTGALPLSLGGEHTVSLPIVHALNEINHQFIVIHLDAHTDFRMEYEGSATNHATVMRRVFEVLGPDRLIQLGIRSGTRDEFAFLRDHFTLMPWNQFGPRLLLERVRDAPVYLSLDLDVLDPACFPGTGNPEAGGWFYDDLERFLAVLDQMRVLGADVVELNPGLDRSDASSIMAAKIVRELLLIMGRNS